MRQSLYLILGLALLHPQSVFAEPGGGDRVSQVEDIAREANQKYKSGQYSEAIALYRQAYFIRRAGTLLYNIALIYDRKLQDMELAERHYREYLSADDTVPKLAARAQERLREFERVRSTLAPRPVRRVRRPQKSDVRQVPAETTAVALTPEAQASAPSWLMWSGGAIVLGGGALWGVAFYESERFAASKSTDDKKALRKSAELNAFVGDIVAATGGAVLLTGVIWWLASGDADPSGPTLSLLPASGGLSLGGTF